MDVYVFLEVDVSLYVFVHVCDLKSLNRYYSSIFVALHQLFGESESDDAVRDNAAGAVARMIMTQPQAVPLAQVIDYGVLNLLSYLSYLRLKNF